MVKGKAVLLAVPRCIPAEVRNRLTIHLRLLKLREFDRSTLILFIQQALSRATAQQPCHLSQCKVANAIGSDRLV